MYTSRTPLFGVEPLSQERWWNYQPEALEIHVCLFSRCQHQQLHDMESVAKRIQNSGAKRTIKNKKHKFWSSSVLLGPFLGCKKSLAEPYDWTKSQQIPLVLEMGTKWYTYIPLNRPFKSSQTDRNSSKQKTLERFLELHINYDSPKNFIST